MSRLPSRLTRPLLFSGTTNIFYTKAEPGNFMLKMEIKVEGSGANGGVQYRSQNVPHKPFEIPPGISDAQRKQIEQMRQAQEPLIKRNAPWNVAGYQLDLDYANMFSGQLYEQDSKRFTHFSPKGLIGFEIEGPGVITISHRNVWLENLQ